MPNYRRAFVPGGCWFFTLNLALFLFITAPLGAIASQMPTLVETVGAAQSNGGRGETQARPEKVRIVTMPDGTKFALVRWAIGSRENIDTLSIPLAYLPIVGDDPRIPDPFVGTEIFEAMLWDMKPKPRHREMPGAERNQLVVGMLESVLSGTNVRDETRQLSAIAKMRFADVKRNAYQRMYHLEVTRRPERFGLKRIGAIHDLGDRTPVGLYDFYYAGDDPETSSDFMTCTDEAVPDDPPPGKSANPGCSHWFALPELSATVKLTYRRRHLGEWREIKRRVKALLVSWR
jgi:hypothetical protein